MLKTLFSDSLLVLSQSCLSGENLTVGAALAAIVVAKATPT
jgi:hypothetical protein